MIIIGHRGAKGLAPENTLASFAKALEHGVGEIEFDVRVTKDKVAVVHHDQDVHDQIGNKLSVAGHTYAELLAHKPDLPTYEAAMRAINRRVPALVEVKRGVPAKPVIAVTQKLLSEGWLVTDLLFGSFNQALLIELHRALPLVPIVVIERWSGVRASYRARQLGTKRLNMNQRWLWSGFIKGMARRGYQLAPYTLNDPVKARRWATYGITAVITDFPDRF